MLEIYYYKALRRNDPQTPIQMFKYYAVKIVVAKTWNYSLSFAKRVMYDARVI